MSDEMNKVVSDAVAEICAVVLPYIPTKAELHQVSVIVQGAIERRCTAEAVELKAANVKQREEIARHRDALSRTINELESIAELIMEPVEIHFARQAVQRAIKAAHKSGVE